MKAIYIKQNLKLVIFLLGSFITVISNAQTTEHYSDETDNATSFSHNGLSFSIGGSYLHIENFTGYGYTGSVPDHHYVDNSSNLMGSAGVIGSFTNTGSDFYVHDFYLFPSANGTTSSNAGTIIIRGKLNSSTEFTHTVQSGDINTSSSNNFFTYINLSSYSSTPIDELEFETTGSLIYIAIDAFKHSVAASAPTVTTTAASSISTTSATLGGNATSDGGDAISEKGIVYSTTDTDPTIGAPDVTKESNGFGTGSFSESIGSLSINTTYYYNSYAINTEGTSYGIASSFKTLKATPTVTAWPTAAGITYGEDLTSAILSGGTASVSGSFAYDNSAIAPNAGTYSADLTFTPTDASNYNTVAGNTNVAVAKATPVITWENPFDISYGIALSSTQLNAFADIGGSFEYSPAAGIILEIGDNQELTQIFTPTDTDNYKQVNSSVFINVFQITGIKDISELGMSIYPNPTNGLINFESKNNIIKKITVSDITGKVIIVKTQIQQNETLNLSNFENNIYVISIQTDKKLFTKKIIKR